MPHDAEPPPSYSPDPADDETRSDGTGAVVEPQIIIIPIGNDVSFQAGYLGADGEHAAIEGELQLKCADDFGWERITMCLRSVETAYETEIELGNTEVVLASSSSENRRASFPFAIPLPPDTAQCLHSLRSSLSHTLTAKVYAAGRSAPVLTKSVLVHTRRYTSHSHVCTIAPETRQLAEPTAMQVQVPRTTFKAGEPIPVYLTVPVPRRELVVEQGLRLRNVRAELVRIVRVRTSTEDEFSSGSAVATESILGEPSSSTRPSSDAKTMPPVPGEQKVIALSGAACRLHPARPVQIRLVLHPPVGSPLAMQPHDLPSEDYYAPDTVECATITQTTLLHSVSFRLRVHVAFMNMSSHTERVSTLEIPIVLLPPTAELPQVEQSVDTAYHKKHDQPPVRTNRLEDIDVPRYEEGEAGPSYHSAPPPFEEREAPPPFFSEPEASTSSRLPTFLESEHEIYIPLSEDPTMAPPSMQPNGAIEGEGVLYGFPPSEQFDGYADMDRSFTPPPTVEMASRDTDVTSLASMNPTAAIEAMGLALGLDHSDDSLAGPPPPPPPPMDDPSDPPPSIDSDFRDPEGTHQSPRHR
ncbi:uncharacterized protein C8Q71DRAFT_724294 [Rhodofomes roseus]|uniref:Arrestin-like N-terminal domain-containing protein n=1 Tax=Rhodofomes roseus TaxID=34475 RepID=A0ABQ8KDQ0_9APHY|nr:uncharacterized protein C8Q71DRAFT_724294 [Rhodofomes roseus]KAH9835666.1 hypothetical protein C8Q71DRAFT_724294 [Rhodofomes roseus]